MNRNNHPNGPYTDLTIYDVGLDRYSEDSLNWLKCVYATIVFLNIIFAGFMLIGAISNIDIINMIYCIFSATAIAYSIAYVYFPRSNMAKSRVCKCILAVFMVVSIIYLIVVIIVVSNLDVYEWAYEYDEDESIIRCVFALVVLIFSIPNVHCILLLAIRKRRWRVAVKMNQEFVQRRVFQAPPPVFNANMGNQYMPPNVPLSQQQMHAQAQVIRPPLPRLNQQVPASLNQGLRSETRQNMHNREPNPMSFQDPNARLQNQVSFQNPQSRVPNPTPFQNNRAEYVPRHPYMQQVDEQESLLSDNSRRHSEAMPYRPSLN